MATNKLPLQTMQKLHRKLRFLQFCFLVGQIYIYFYLLVDFNHSLDSVKVELIYIVETMPDLLLVWTYVNFIYFRILTEFK